jgi:biopolymer transport protein ExbB
MRRAFLIAALGLALCISPVWADNASGSVDDAIRQTRADIEQATSELIALRDAIARERRPLADEADALRKEVAALRAEAERMRSARQDSEQERLRRAEILAHREETYRYLESLLTEYQRSAGTRMHEIEAQYTEANQTTDAADSDPSGFPGQLADGLMQGVERAEHRFGGLAFEASVVDADGRDVQGQALLFGPVAYFVSHDKKHAGLITSQFGSGYPSLEQQVPLLRHADLVALAEGREAMAPVDVSGGDALKVAEARVGWREEFEKGGFVMWPLTAVGLLALVLALWKSGSLWRMRVTDPGIWAEALRLDRDGNTEAARAVVARAPQPLRSVFSEGLTYRAVPRDRLEEILHEHVVGFMPTLERHLGTLAVLGGIAPLLGLLGTVTGMIYTFQLVTVFGSGDAKLLSGGISEALITTKYGLVIAVPVLLAHAALVRRSRGLLASLEQTALTVVNDLKGRESV